MWEGGRTGCRTQGAVARGGLPTLNAGRNVGEHGRHECEGAWKAGMWGSMEGRREDKATGRGLDVDTRPLGVGTRMALAGARANAVGSSMALLDVKH